MPAGTDVATTYTWDGTYHEIKGVNLDALVKGWILNPVGNFGVIIEQSSGTSTQKWNFAGYIFAAEVTEERRDKMGLFCKIVQEPQNPRTQE